MRASNVKFIANIYTVYNTMSAEGRTSIHYLESHFIQLYTPHAI